MHGASGSKNALLMLYKIQSALLVPQDHPHTLRGQTNPSSADRRNAPSEGGLSRNHTRLAANDSVKE